MREWLENIDEIDLDCILHWEYLLGRELKDYQEYHTIDSMLGEMVLEWQEKEEFFKQYPEFEKYKA